jgi:hypothetical protein
MPDLAKMTLDELLGAAVALAEAALNHTKNQATIRIELAALNAEVGLENANSNKQVRRKLISVWPDAVYRPQTAPTSHQP